MAAEPSQRPAIQSTLLKSMQDMLGPLNKKLPLPQQAAMGFFTDTSLCIGCKACEVACKQWNQLPAKDPEWTGSSYDNTGELSAITWRHVQFIEQIGRTTPSNVPTYPVGAQFIAPAGAAGSGGGTLAVADGLFPPQRRRPHESGHQPPYSPDIPLIPLGTALPFFNTDRWLMHSDVCKHCANAPCQEACPTGAIIRTEFDTVYVQQDICNGCGYCIVACPFGVIARDNKDDHRAHKCTLCYDRLKDNLEPACAKACPTDSITFGEVAQLKAHARERLGLLHERGVSEAQLYGVDDNILDGGLNSFFLLLDKPGIYNLPQDPVRPSNNVAPASFWAIVATLVLGLLGILIFRKEN